MLPLSSEPYVFPYAIQKTLKIKIHEPIIILSVVSYEYETSLTLREGYGLSMFLNRVVRKIFGPRK
jgi:hypothetical protein